MTTAVGNKGSAFLFLFLFFFFLSPSIYIYFLGAMPKFLEIKVKPVSRDGRDNKTEEGQGEGGRKAGLRWEGCAGSRELQPGMLRALRRLHRALCWLQPLGWGRIRPWLCPCPLRAFGSIPTPCSGGQRWLLSHRQPQTLPVLCVPVQPQGIWGSLPVPTCPELIKTAHKGP